ncbi:electron transport complex subunit RsxC [Chitinivibrio alkaliphilus]|uniref:Ion-translocating oxidoreductase complex subunit C n=1 Tax=Chitinivibrio alkaliphilus ACht1 TaxID=1313304 RepID=U7D861_9BACT|nr:electron transport complex subunit RsxC [Chitinivibrio alkaliphilus]ERP32128.1 electron transport complex, RnfABCDGE type, C subunit [Chitinivibrio alkaliphilus ACht1]
MFFRKKTFRGGIHPPDCKDTATEKTTTFPAPARVFIPMVMHIGAPARVLVKKGDTVRKGACIGEAGGKISAPVHSSISGTVVKVATYPHPAGNTITTVEIENDFSDTEVTLPPIHNWHETASDVLIQRISEAGIIGKGGASFPTAVKLTPPPGVNIDTLLINAAECEPYLTADYRLMLENTEEFLHGVAIAKRILDTEQTIIGIEKNKPEAISALSRAIKRSSRYSFIELVPLETKYPQGGEKQLISALTGREVPHGKLPLAVQTVVLNTGTAKAIHDAVLLGKPLVERIVTVTGPTVQKPGNYRIPVGTPVQDIVSQCEADLSATSKVILGGPMMGLALADLRAPILKSTSGVLCLPEKTPAQQSAPCINCGNCVKACPMRLVPSHFAKFVENERFDALEEAHITDCIDCGCCTFTCPSKINIVHAIKLGKQTLKENNRTL